MDWFFAVFVLPEVCLLVLGFFAIAISLGGSGHLDRLKRLCKSRGREVGSSYWGQYLKESKEATSSIPPVVAIASISGATTTGITLPKLLKAPE